MKYRVCHVTPGVWKVQWRIAWAFRGFEKDRMRRPTPGPKGPRYPDLTFDSHQAAHDHIATLVAARVKPRWKARHGKWQ